MISYIGKDAPFDVFCVEDAAELGRVLNGRTMEEALPTARKGNSQFKNNDEPSQVWQLGGIHSNKSK